jgi:hypothetical protein
VQVVRIELCQLRHLLEMVDVEPPDERWLDSSSPINAVTPRGKICFDKQRAF